jgi:hypothetical protein
MQDFKKLILVSLFFLASTALALEVGTDKSVIYPTTIGSTTIWSDYITISVKESGKPVQNASVSIKTESDIQVSTATTDANGSAMLSILLRSPYDLLIFVDGKDSGRRIQLLISGEQQKIKEEQKPQATGTGTFDLNIPFIFILIITIIVTGVLWKKKR